MAELTSTSSVWRAGLWHPRYWLSWLAVLLLIPIAFLPWRWRHGLGKWLGNWTYKRNTKRRQVILRNLSCCFPELDAEAREQLARQHLHHYGCALMDYSLLFFRSRRWLTKQIDLSGAEQLRHDIAQQQNIMLLLAHSVWLEFAPVAIGQHFASYGSYKPFANPVLDHLIANSRLKDVDFILAREAGMMKLVRTLQPGRLLFFLPDEHHGLKHSVFAPFFASTKATLTTPARLAKLGQAQAYPIIAFFNNGRYKIIVGKVLTDFATLPAEQAAALMNQGFAELIQQSPEQYMWLLKLLKTRPVGEANLYTTNEAIH